MDFVTFGIAKKLKEKGFSLNNEYIEFIGCRFIYSDECTIKRISTIGAYEKEYFGENIDCPTISQVLKWLRNKKGIFLEMEHITRNSVGCNLIERKNGGVIASYKYDKFRYANKNPLAGNTYEKCALYAIEYVLDNLI